MRKHKSINYVDNSDVDLFNVRRLPARLTLHQVAVILSLQEYEVLLLMQHGILKCLNSPQAGANCRKFFSAAYIEQIAADPIWLAKATNAVARAVREKNQGQFQPWTSKFCTEKQSAEP